MNGLKSATLWIVIFLVFILMFVKYNEKEQPKTLGITKVMELAEGKRLVKVSDKEGELEGEYRDDAGNKVKFTSKYAQGQEDKVLDVMTKNGVPAAALISPDEFESWPAFVATGSDTSGSSKAA